MSFPEKNTSVKKLLHSINEVLEQYAENLSAIAKGKEPKVFIDEKVVDKVMKMIEKTTSLEAFEAFCNGDRVKAVLDKSEKGESKNIESNTIDGNPFEARSKKIGEKLNGRKV
ncbi:MAG: hypothetical protein JWQ09_5891 [Segetibacter sp.]|nr:hypothetical protein [Segetibacter sp.]